MRLMGLIVADPGDSRACSSSERMAPGEFAYYALSAVHLAPMAAALVPDAAHINRAVGSFRFLAGIPGDRDPPAMLK